MLATIRHEFVETIPEHLDNGVVYVSLTYATVVHNCCCGCGHEVVTPLHPRQWSLIFNGDTISLTPSIGNWSFPCRSHYWIRAGQIRSARSFTETEIAKLRADDQASLHDHYKSNTSTAPEKTTEPGKTWRAKLSRWARKRNR